MTSEGRRYNKVFIVGPDWGINSMFRERNYLVMNDINNSDIVVFTGGSDIGPNLYGQSLNRKTSPWPDRDKKEVAIYEYTSKQQDKHFIGICRGGQLLNVLSGGSMWQHVNNHAIGGVHKGIDLRTKKEYFLTSVHHQMMRPSKDAEIITHSGNIATHVEDWQSGVNKIEEHEGYDIENVWYPKTRSLCFQGHPEFDHSTQPNSCRNYFFELVDRYIQGKNLSLIDEKEKEVNCG